MKLAWFSKVFTGEMDADWLRISGCVRALQKLGF
jgi:hypothetical protein